MGKPGSRIGVGWPRDQRQLEHATVNSGAHIRVCALLDQQPYKSPFACEFTRQPQCCTLMAAVSVTLSLWGLQGLAFMTNVSNKSVVRWWYPLDWRWSRAPEEAQTFVVRPGLDGAPGSVSLELLGSPGVWLSAFTWPDAHEGCIGWGCRWFCRHAPSHSSHGQSEPKYGERIPGALPQGWPRLLSSTIITFGPTVRTGRVESLYTFLPRYDNRGPISTMPSNLSSV